jgi:large subunit ribosomal protein L23
MMDVILRPIATEKTMLQTENENKLSFLVLKRSTKKQIREEIEKKFSVKVSSINTVITKNGKKAIVTLSKDFSADEIAGRIGIF